MNDHDNDYDEGYLNFKPFRIELQGSCELKIPLTNAEIEKLEEEEEKESENDEENS